MVGGRDFFFKNETSGRSLSCLCVITIINDVIMLRACVRASSVMCAHCITFCSPESSVPLRFLPQKRGQKPTAPGVPRRSPIQVLSWPDDA